MSKKTKGQFAQKMSTRACQWCAKHIDIRGIKSHEIACQTRHAFGQGGSLRLVEDEIKVRRVRAIDQSGRVQAERLFAPSPPERKAS